SAWKSGERGSAVPARVISQHRKFWALAGDFGESWAEAAGKLRLAAEEGADWPAVGDWVAAEIQEPGNAATIQGVLPRRSKFVRKAAGKALHEQVIAANIDTALLVSALDGDFNLRRAERYLAQCWESGARPIVVLNKADACADVQKKALEIERIAAGTIAHVVSAKTGQGFDELEKYLRPGQTLVLLGSSGVGKSTIVNRLLGRAIQEVRQVRESDGGGKHTTTARELFALPGGALLIDTPGLRELQLWDADAGIAQAFSDIEMFAARCRFGNCRHEGEPGCAVQQAVETGTLDLARLENWRKVLREQAFLQRKMDPEARQEQKEYWKTVHRAQRQKYQQRQRDGGKR
ncbi:MAG TPA: ribosome small subunit-dependent GTPase A, partial [Candidatus Angelobacter sp.]|nr:ribosome small subunit-dependent GTPase A [Candidatus Angelobacter sp.]